MNHSAIQNFRRNIAAKRSTVGLWVTLEAPGVTEMAVALGLDWVVVDAEHGHLDWKEIVEHLRAAVRSSTVVLVRIAELNSGLIKRALDLGADGVVVPWIETADQLRQAVAYARYPLEGVRGIGAERATAWGQAFVEHTSQANENVLVVPIIETVRAAREAPQLLAVDGVEMIFFGPADFSASAGYRGQWEGPGVADEILRLKGLAEAAGRHCGVMATSPENMQQRLAQGFSMVGLGTDTGLLIRSLREYLKTLGRDCAMRDDLQACNVQSPTFNEEAEHRTSNEKLQGSTFLRGDRNLSGQPTPPAPPCNGGEFAARPPLPPLPKGGSDHSPLTTYHSPPPPLERPPESFRPDRPEVMNAVGSGPQVELAPGVTFDCLVGGHNRAKRLTTGFVRFAAGARLPCHTHEFAESITLLAGAATIEVEGRQYALGRLDNVTIPRGVAHAAVNSSRQESLLHVAMASDDPTRQLVDCFFPRRTMPADSSGVEGRERVTRGALVERTVAGPNTEFIDYFNSDLMPGLEMSGGYGLFHPQGRLPAHIHDFDESIAIISGRATCVVEGRRYEMQDRATALQPRGRVHYFINETTGPMEMIWVYAGPQPERIVVAERCATTEGNPWK